jgi:hypothetical protein
MKRIKYLLVILLLIWLDNCFAQRLSIMHFEQQLRSLLVFSKDASETSQIYFYDIIEKRQVTIDSLFQLPISIVQVYTLDSHTYKNFILSYENRFYFINMHRPIDEILHDVLFHVEESDLFSKEIVLEFLRLIGRTYRENI